MYLSLIETGENELNVVLSTFELQYTQSQLHPAKFTDCT